MYTTVKSIDVLFFSHLREFFRSFDSLFLHCIFMIQSSHKFVMVCDLWPILGKERMITSADNIACLYN